MGISVLPLIIVFSPTFIHLLVVFLVLAGGDVIQPGLVVQVPADGFLYTFLKLQGGFPTQLFLQFR